ncbi:hypothetical protein [Helicobacter pylori]|nr:hypothetical protein [Helicobacter pylori]
MKSMQKLWGKKVSDIDFSEFVKILENKTHVGELPNRFSGWAFSCFIAP